MLLHTDLAGNQVADPNFRLRFFLIILGGIIAGASILYWRSKLLLSQEYVEFPTHQAPHKSPLKASNSVQQSERLQKELNNE